jgi:hypothetical protein
LNSGADATRFLDQAAYVMKENAALCPIDTRFLGGIDNNPSKQPDHQAISAV